MKIILLFFSCFVSSLGFSSPAFAAEERPPNIIFILSDDLGWGDLHCYGHPYAKTPNIDKLAAEGTRFQQFYATGVTCCPSRTGFMTSWLPARYPTYPANGGFAERMTITELLHRHGYATGHFGKWHIGPSTKSGTYGIDTVGGDDTEGSEGDRKRKQQSDSARGRDGHIFDEAISFIEKHKNGPFYVNIWDHIPHHPVNPSPAEIEDFGPLQVDESQFSASMQEKFIECKKQGGDVSTHMRAWLAEIRAMDVEIGSLMKRLDDLGLRDNTIVVFTSDQGPAPIRDAAVELSERKEKRLEKKGKTPETDNKTDDIRLNAMGYTGILRGGKHGQYEGGVRIPFIIRWPGHTPAGRVDEKSVISGADWLPTLCALTGITINIADFDGEDASKAWLGSDFIRTKPLFWKTSSPNSPGSIRIGEWKLHFPNSKRGEVELYNVLADPGEQTNLANKKPAKVKELIVTLEAWQATLPKEYIKTDDKDK